MSLAQVESLSLHNSG